MAGKGFRGNAAPVGDFAAQVLDPILRRRAGMSVALVQSWEEIAGPRLAASSRPERISWPRRASDEEPFEPATLVVACQGLAALHLQHETGELIARVNAFLGYPAIGRVRIVQKPVEPAGPVHVAPPTATEEETRRVAETVADVEDEGLREALARLGRSVMAEKRRRR
ncbi:MAG: DciA family protein [Rhizobiaceae bacterium]|nr:DciA family protein [Rhizobiaceae bacterium]MCV0405671.1 DciA family protein [Rhizobiaceae bacterium]